MKLSRFIQALILIILFIVASVLFRSASGPAPVVETPIQFTP